MSDDRLFLGLSEARRARDELADALSKNARAAGRVWTEEDNLQVNRIFTGLYMALYQSLQGRDL